MNIEKLKAAEAAFFHRYPGGFADPEMVAIGKKHRMDKLIPRAAEQFSEDSFSRTGELSENLTKFVSASSMVSVFEKPRFRDYTRSLNSNELEQMINGLHEMLYMDEEKGFNQFLGILRMGKLAKWTLMTVIPAYLRPDRDVFIKPTTVKNVISVFEIENLVYRPQPSYDFYRRYRDIINGMKGHVDPSLSPGNAAFSGFLMMTMEQIR